MLGEDTDIAVHASCDTMGLKFSLGDDVVCVCGEMKGLKGAFAGNRADGRVLVRVATGVYMELPRICLKRDGK